MILKSFQKLFLCLLVCGSLLLTGCGIPNKGVKRETDSSRQDTYYGTLHHQRELVYEELVVKPEWQEIKLLTPINSGNSSHVLALELKDWEQWDNKLPRYLKNPQGQEVKVELQLIDEEGVPFPIGQHLSLHGAMHFMPNYYDNFETRYSEIMPRDKKYPKLRVRSTARFKCERIIWLCVVSGCEDEEYIRNGKPESKQ